MNAAEKLYRVAVNGEEIGTYPMRELQVYWKAGTLDREAYYLHEGIQTWRPLAPIMGAHAVRRSRVPSRKRNAVAWSIVIISVALILMALFIGTPHGEVSQDQVELGLDESSWPYQFVASKTETTGHLNEMEHFAYSGPVDLENLKAFCVARRSRSSAKAFFYVVIFDDAANARFPSNPFTAEYGLESDTLIHIRAIYVFNRMNGFSELRYHERNIFENAASRLRL